MAQPDLMSTSGSEIPPEQPPAPTVVGVRFQPAGKPYHFEASQDLLLTAL